MRQKYFSFSIIHFSKKIKSGGFTLLELLVVISVIAILITLGITSYSTAQMKARDAKRKGDLRDIQQALEQYYSVCNNIYPSVQANFTSINCSSPAISIMPVVPKDPRTTPYNCQPCTEGGFHLCTTMETQSQPYCVDNQQ